MTIEQRVAVLRSIRSMRACVIVLGVLAACDAEKRGLSPPAESREAVAPADGTDAWLEAQTRNTKLRILFLGNGTPTSKGWSAVGRMKELTELHAVGAVLDADACEQIGKLARLEELVLARSTLGPAGLRQLARLSRLTDLDLSGAKGLVGKDFAPVGDLESLKILDLAGTDFDDEALSCLVRLKHVWLLVLRGTKITDSGLPDLAQMESIKTLYLSRTGVRGNGMEALAPLIKLTTLNLDHLDLRPATLEHLRALQGLEHLDLSYTPTTDDALAHLAGLKYLKTLKLDETAVTDAGLRHLAGLIRLWHLWLPARVVGPGLSHLHKLGRLETLILGVDPVPDALSAFRNAVPDCEVSIH